MYKGRIVGVNVPVAHEIDFLEALICMKLTTNTNLRDLLIIGQKGIKYRMGKNNRYYFMWLLYRIELSPFSSTLGTRYHKDRSLAQDVQTYS